VGYAVDAEGHNAHFGTVPLLSRTWWWSVLEDVAALMGCDPRERVAQYGDSDGNKDTGMEEQVYWNWGA